MGQQTVMSIRVLGAPRGARGVTPSTAYLSYHGGIGGGGVETGAHQVYLVFWGAQWNNNDPWGEAAILESLFSHVGGSSWNNSVTQYCQDVPAGTVICGPKGTHATNPPGVLGGVWYDNSAPAPVHPSAAQLAGEAVAAAVHFAGAT